MKKYALLIGVEEYEDRNISPVLFARADVLGLAERLRESCRFDVVRTLASLEGPESPTLGRVVDALDDLAGDLRPDDLFLFYFGGHGVEINGKGHLLTCDTRRRKLSLTPTLPLADLQEIFERADVGRRILMLDSCRNDPFAGRGDADGALGEKFCRDVVAVAKTQPREAPTTRATTAVLSACWEGHRAWPLKAKGHGVFTYYILQGIDRAAWKGDELEFDRLAEYVGEEVKRWSAASLDSTERQDCWYQKFGTPRRLVLATQCERPSRTLNDHRGDLETMFDDLEALQYRELAETLDELERLQKAEGGPQEAPP